MDKRSRMLLIVEGERAERRLFDHLFAAYGLCLEYDVYCYRTNIHDLYSRMFQTGDDAGDYDLLGVLKERETDPAKRQILDGDYSDVLLVFDYDPHDNRFSPESLARMVAYFNESTDQGKLYVNYPMLEAYRHFATVPDPDYPQRTVEVATLGRYKALVERESFCTDVALFDKDIFDTIINQTAEKARGLSAGRQQSISRTIYAQPISHEKIVEYQNQLVDKHALVSVLATCLLFVQDYNPSLVR